ncbi:lysine methyltransferase [Colletotrichum sojae]|uniref:Lysine methyltransferase n=1 Tax=Colletotrichum sojae TaxID=2175907 RepID=A0A8H6JCY9_9PEZI|nr:lysine methyltransferase [Colletotrichum sojae]
MCRSVGNPCMSFPFDNAPTRTFSSTSTTPLLTTGHLSFYPEPLFTTRTSGSKGRGIFATKRIPAGNLIAQEPPIVFLDRNWMEAVSSEQDRGALQAMAVEKLPAMTRRTVHELYAGSFEESLEYRILTNGYGISGGPAPNWPGLDSESDLGMVAVHANISWDWDALSHRLYAARDIALDEEITISYMNPIQTLRARQKFAKDVLGFECACSQCKAPGQFSNLSDDRINEILLLASYLENRQIAPAEPTAMAELLVGLYRQEGLHTLICKAYAIEAREWNGAGYEYQARKWAYESVQAGLTAAPRVGSISNSSQNKVNQTLFSKRPSNNKVPMTVGSLRKMYRVQAPTEVG